MKRLIVVLTVLGGATLALAVTNHTALQCEPGVSGRIAPQGFKLTSAVYTVECWINPSSLTGEEEVMDQFCGNGTTGDWRFGFREGGKISLFCRNFVTGNWMDSGVVAPLNCWTHIAASCDGGVVKLYVNGERKADFERTAGAEIVPTQAGTFYVGGQKDRAFNGRISDCRVWNCVRTDDEIASARFSRLAGSETGLVAYWPLDEGAGSAAGDHVSKREDSIEGGGMWSDMPTPFSERGTVSDDRYVLKCGGDAASSTVDGRLSVGDFFKLRSSVYTVEAWVHPLSLGTEMEIFDQFAGAPAQDWRFAIGNDSRLAVFSRGWLASGVNWMKSQALIVPTRWTHVAASCDGDVIKIYIDGKLDSEHIRTSSTPYTPVTTATFYVGGSSSFAIHGELSDCRVWGCVRTESEIARTKDMRLTGKEAGLIGYWPLNESSGGRAENWAALGISDGNIQGVVSHKESVAPLRPRTSARNDSYAWNGGSFNTGTSICYDQYTLEAWVQPDDIEGENLIFAQYKYDKGDVIVGIKDGHVGSFFRGFVAENWMLTPTGVRAGEWVHVAVVNDGNAIRVFLNGELDLEYARTATSPINVVSGCPLIAGGKDAATPFRGRVSEVRAWNIARSAADVGADYRKKALGTDAGLLCLWPLDQTTGGSPENYARGGIANGMPLSGASWIGKRRTPFYESGLMLIFR